MFIANRYLITFQSQVLILFIDLRRGVVCQRSRGVDYTNLKMASNETLQRNKYSQPDENGLQLLHYAAQYGLTRIVEILITKFDCQPDCRGVGQHAADITPLHLASANGHLEVVRTLLDYGSDSSCTIQSSYNALHVACVYGHIEIVRELYARKPLDGKGVTLLHIACRFGHLSIVRYLINYVDIIQFLVSQNECILNSIDIYCKINPLYILCMYGNLDCVTVILQSLNSMQSLIHDQNGSNIVHFACVGGNLAVVKYIVVYCRGMMHCSNHSGNTPLHLACMYGHIDVVKYLVKEHEYDVKHENGKGFSALHCACLCLKPPLRNGNNLDVVKYLVEEENIDPILSNSGGITPLHLASLYGGLQIVRYLTEEKHCDLTLEMNSGITSFLLACSSGVLELVKYFINVLGPSILAACDQRNGRTTLHYACRFGCITVAKYLVNEYTNPNLKDKDGMTPLHHACSCKTSVAWKAALVGQNKHMEVIRFLVEECNSSLETTSNTGCTPLHIASGQENLAVIKHLVQHYKCNPSVTNNHGDTALHIACRAGVSLKIIEYLVKEGWCDPCTKGKDGMTALHIACSYGNLEIVQFLVEACPCSFRTQSDDKTTPLGEAKSSGHTHIQKYLISYRKGKPTVEHSPYQLDSHLEKDANVAIKLLADKRVPTVEYYNKWRDTLLHLACLYGDEEIVMYLIEDKKYKTTVINSEGDSALNMACWGGKLETVKYLIEEKVCDPNKQRNSPLHMAAWSGSLGVVKYLIEEENCDPKVTDSYGNTSLHIACACGAIDIVKYLVEGKYLHQFLANKNGNLPLHIACSCGTTDIVQYLVECSNHGIDDLRPVLEGISGGDVLLHILEYSVQRLPNKKGELALHRACHQGSLQIVRLVSNFDVDTISHSVETPLSIACTMGKSDIVRFLIEEKCCNPLKCVSYFKCPADIAYSEQKQEIIQIIADTSQSFKDESGNTLLHIACKYNLPSEIRYLTEEAHYDQGLPNDTGELPLHIACAHKSLEIVKLVSSNSNVNSKDTKFGNTPLHIACWCEAFGIITYLVEEKDADLNIPDNCGKLPLHVVCSIGSLLETVKLVSQCDDVNHQDNDGNTALHIACETCTLEVVKYLVAERKCKQTLQNKDRQLPFHVACYEGTLEKVKLVCSDCNVDANAQTKTGDTAMHIACENVNLELVKYLLQEKECNPLIPNSHGELPLHKVCKQNCSSLDDIICIIKMVSTPDFNCNIQTNSRDTPLHIAANSGIFPELVQYLIEKKRCDANLPNSRGQLPLHIACSISTDTALELVKMLSEHTLNVNAKAKHGNTPLHIACRSSNDSIVKYLIDERCADVNIQNDYGETVLHLAVSHTYGYSSHEMHEFHTEFVSYLMTHQCDPTIKNMEKELPLHIACRQQCLEVVRLVSPDIHNLNVDSRTSLGNTPLHEACGACKQWSSSRNVPSIVEYLLKEKHCNSNAQNNEGKTPLHYACMRGAVNEVECLLSSGAKPLLVDKNGQTPLKFIYKLEIIKKLLDHGIDPNVLYETCCGLLVDYFSQIPPACPLKVLFVGHPSTGKTTLVESLKCEAIEHLPEQCANVEPHTAGIIPTKFESKTYGPAVLYDFAGQPEFYASHEAVIQHLIAHIPPVYLLLVNMDETEELIMKQVLYWISFIENKCEQKTLRPHLIVIGSHADLVENANQKIKHILNAIKSKVEKSKLRCISGCFTMDCREPCSMQLTELQQKLKSISEQVQGIAKKNFTSHLFYAFLLSRCKHGTFVKNIAETIEWESKANVNPRDTNYRMFYDQHLLKKYTGSLVRDDSAEEVYNKPSVVTDKDFSEANFQYMEGCSALLLPKTQKEIIQCCEDLNDRGHVIFVKNLDNPEYSLIIVNTQACLSDLIGTLFAPAGFKQYHDLATNTGVVSLSTIYDHFPEKNVSIAVFLPFLCRLEFCQEICDKEVLKHLKVTDKKSYCNDEKYFFFPGLVRDVSPGDIWKPDSQYVYQCGWMLQCKQPQDFFTPRFIQVLILRLAFTYALVPSRSDATTDGQSPIIEMVCSVWKSGICWNSMNGIETVVEVREQSRVVILMRCINKVTSQIACVCLRSALIQKVLHAAKEFCPSMTHKLQECFVHPRDLQYPPKPSSQVDVFTLPDIARTMVKAMPCIINNRNHFITIDELLCFEPYAYLGSNTIRALHRDDTSREKVSDKFCSEIAEQIYAKNLPSGQSDEDCLQKRMNMYAALFDVDHFRLQEQISRAPEGFLHELMRVFILQRDKADSYPSLKSAMDEGSVFCGRNPEYWYVA